MLQQPFWKIYYCMSLHVLLVWLRMLQTQTIETLSADTERQVLRGSSKLGGLHVPNTTPANTRQFMYLFFKHPNSDHHLVDQIQKTRPWTISVYGIGDNIYKLTQNVLTSLPLLTSGCNTVNFAQHIWHVSRHNEFYKIPNFIGAFFNKRKMSESYGAVSWHLCFLYFDFTNHCICLRCVSTVRLMSTLHDFLTKD